jgi:type IV secretion system protein VirB9
MKGTYFHIAGLVVMVVCACSTVDVERKKIREIDAGNRELGINAPVRSVSRDEVRDRELKKVEEQTNVVVVHEPVYIPQIETGNKARLTQDQVVQQSLNEAMVTPQNFVGGTQMYDYNEHKQFPVVCKLLALTVIQLQDGEVPIGQPYLSDTLRWEITGDVWRTTDGKSVQLIMLKPFEKGLKTNMIVVTNKRIYQLLLSSTDNAYMPMVRFRYPFETKFVTERTIAEDEMREQESGSEENYISYNYKIVSGWIVTGWFKPEWTPTEVWDDGHKTYIRVPRNVLQKEYPVVFEKRNYIVNYRLQENIMIIDKLVSALTLRLDGKRVKIAKKKGEPADLQRYIRNPIEMIEDGGEAVESRNVVFAITGTASWLPKKVIEFNGETLLLFEEDHFTEAELYIIDGEGKPVDFVKDGNIITIPGVITKISLAYNLETAEVSRN